MLNKTEVEEIIKEGMNARYQGKYSEALDKFDMVIKNLAESDEEWAKLKIGEAMHQLGVTLQNMGKYYKAALSCLWCTIVYRQVIRDSIGLAYSYFQIPMCRLASGEKVEYIMPDFHKAGEAIIIGISLAKRKDDYKVLGDLSHNLAYISQIEGNRYSVAIGLYSEALIFRRRVKDKKGEGLTLARLAECFLESGDFQPAIAKDYAKNALRVFQEINDVKRTEQVGKILEKIRQEEKRITGQNK